MLALRTLVYLGENTPLFVDTDLVNLFNTPQLSYLGEDIGLSDDSIFISPYPTLTCYEILSKSNNSNRATIIHHDITLFKTQQVWGAESGPWAPMDTFGIF